MLIDFIVIESFSKMPFFIIYGIFDEKKKSKNMKYDNPFTNPVGSVSDVTLRGKGGSVRHEGQFSENNIYYQQLLNADKMKNQDRDALYEKALAYEERLHNLSIETQLDWEKRQEQREYDSPVQELLRQRLAGINPDLAGSSGSSSSGSSSGSVPVTDIDPTQTQVPTSNKYDNTQLVFGGVNAAANMITSLSSAAGTIVQSIGAMELLPSQIEQNSANARMADANAHKANVDADVASSLLEGRVAGQKLQNATAVVQQLAELSDIFSPETSDEELSSSLQTLGVSTADNVKDHLGVVRQFQANPAARAKYHKNSVEAAYAAKEHQMTTNEVVARNTQYAMRIQASQKAFEADRSELKARVASLLNTTEYANTLSQIDKMEAGYRLDSVEFAQMRLQRDVEAYLNNIFDLSLKMEENDKDIQQIFEDAQEQNRPLTSYETSIIKSLSNYSGMLSALGSEELQLLYDIVPNIDMIKYYHESNPKASEGKEFPVSKIEKHNIHAGIVFNGNIHHVATAREIASDIVGKILTAAGIAVGGAIGLRRGKSNPGANSSYYDSTDDIMFAD